MPADVPSDVIKLRCGTDRNRRMCQDRVQTIRKGLVPDPLNQTKKYDIRIVDKWLSGQVDMEKLKALVAIDAQVDEILLKHV